MNTPTIHTDLCIIGAGPVGLFAVFEAGLLKMRCHLIDALPQIGGQLSEIYPQKPIYDIPGYPEINAQDLVDNLMEQAKPFHPSPVNKLGPFRPATAAAAQSNKRPNLSINNKGKSFLVARG